MPAPYCPVTPEARAWLDYRWAWLRHEFGLKRLREHTLVLPNDTFFPDPYHGTPEDMEKLLARVAGFMGVDVNTIELHYYEEQRPSLGKYEGTAGLYRENEAGKFEIWLEVAQLNDLERMIATMAHELGHVLLLGQKRVSHDEEDHEPLTDLITVFMGLGVFTGNSVMRENYWSAGNFSGWSMGRRGYLPMHEIGYAFAHYAIDREEPKPPWMKALRLDVRKACEQSLKVQTADQCDNSKLVPVFYPSFRPLSVTEDARCCHCNAVLSNSTYDEDRDEGHLVCDACLNLINTEEHAPDGIVSKTITHGIEPVMNYAFYALVLLVVACLIYMMFLL